MDDAEHTNTWLEFWIIPPQERPGMGHRVAKPDPPDMLSCACLACFRQRPRAQTPSLRNVPRRSKSQQTPNSQDRFFSSEICRQHFRRIAGFTAGATHDSFSRRCFLVFVAHIATVLFPPRCCHIPQIFREETVSLILMQKVRSRKEMPSKSPPEAR